MSFVRKALDAFWSPYIWLPSNLTWADLESNEEVTYADYRHLIYPLPLALVFLVLRILLHRFLFVPFGTFLGIKSTEGKKAPPNPILEKAYKSNGKIKHKQVIGLAKQLDWSERQVQRWFRLRYSQHKPSTLTKFCETSWRCFYYTSAFLYGLFCLWDKPWLWDIGANWHNYPHQSITDDCWWYYMISLACYWSLIVSQFFDVKRKDFWQMFVHHVATIFLLSFSWVCNLHRVGTLVLLVHDSGDFLLEAAKSAKYAKFQKVCDVLFLIFTVVWFVTRLGIFPFRIIYSATFDTPKIVPLFPAYYIFNSLMIVLMALHIVWTYAILRVIYRFLSAGQMEKDVRSDSSDEVSEEEVVVSGSSNNLYQRAAVAKIAAHAISE